MQPTPYIFFRDTCAEAMRAYARILGAPEPTFMWFKDMPPSEGMDPSKMPKDAVMHSELKLDGGVMYASDDPSGTTPAMDGCNVYLSFPTFERAQEVYTALMEGGDARMPFEATFWSPGFGSGSDKWGTRWMISIDAPAGA